MLARSHRRGGRHPSGTVILTQLQFLEDSSATAASFRADGSWTVQTEPGTELFRV